VALIADLLAIRTAAPYDMAGITFPVVLGRGTLARGHHVEGSSRLLDALANAEPFVIEGGGHGSHTSHPDGFAAFVRRVIERA
jgi:pimeloyl-ACP methyl ester carboxylesterase